ncbi:MAG: hypothetical protein ACREAW_02825 [Nitrososphaera sp.]
MSCFVPFPIQTAGAADSTFTTDTTINTDQTIELGEIWTVNPDVTLTIESGTIVINHGTIANSGTIVILGIIESDGTINSTGTVDVNGGSIVNNAGTTSIDGNVTISNGGGLGINAGILNVNGTVDIIDGALGGFGTINIDGEVNIAFPGSLGNSGTMNNKAIIINNSTMFNDGTFNNEADGIININAPLGLLGNNGVVNNYGTLNSTGSITNNFGSVINNYGTFDNDVGAVIVGSDSQINNKCGAIFTNLGTLFGVDVNFEECIYNLNLFEDGDPSDDVIDLGEDARAVASTNDVSVDRVIFNWFDPNGTLAHLNVVSVSLTIEAEDAFTPNEPGNWTLEAEFSDGLDLRHTSVLEFTVLQGQTVEELLDHIDTLDISDNVKNSLKAPLNRALKLLNDDSSDNDKAACPIMDAFINHVNAQAGKSLTEEQADGLIDRSDVIKENIDC